MTITHQHPVDRVSTRRTAYRAVGRVVTRQTTRRPRRPQNLVPAAGQSAGRASARHLGGTPLSGWKPDLQNARTPPHRTLRLVTILLLATTITACGWKLRGSYNLPPEITPIAVEGGAVAGELRASLRNSNVLARSTDGPAASYVEILKENKGRRVISVDLDGRVDEYEVRYEVRWQLTAKGTDDKSRRILVAPTTFRANRSYDYNASTVLSTNEQEQRLVENMRNDIAQRILFRLQGVDAGDSEAGSDTDADDDDRDDDSG